MRPVKPLRELMQDLKPDCRARLIEIATNAVSRMQVEKGFFLGSESADLLADGDEALPLNLKRELAGAISDHPFSGFVVGFVQDQLSAAFKYEDVDPRPLIGLPGFEEAPAVATDVVDAFRSLPWRYTFIYPLPLKASHPLGVSQGDKEYRFGASLWLVQAGAAFSQKFPARSKGRTLADLMTSRWQADEPTKWQNDNLYLVHEADGFITRSFTTELANNVRLMVRALGGLLEASRLAKYHYVVQAWPRYPVDDSWIYVYGQQEGSWRWTASVKLEEEHAERLRSLQWLEIDGLQEAQWGAWLEAVTDRLSLAFINRESAALLRRCSQWHFDSRCGTNRLLQFVQATVAIEILLGDKAASDIVGISELLANRCAYSLAQYPAERQKLIAQFKEIYATRSSIVHRGKANLSDTEMNQLWQLTYLCRRLINHELDLMEGKHAGR